MVLYTLGPISDKDASGGPVTLYGFSGGAQQHFQNLASTRDLNDGNAYEEITNADAHSGSQSWYVTGRFYGNPGQGSPHTPSTGATVIGPGTSFTASFWIKLADPTPDPAGSKLDVYMGTQAGNDRTGAHVQICNGKPGDVNAFSMATFSWGPGYQKVFPAVNLDRNSWHHVSWTYTVPDTDPNNETASYSINGGPPLASSPPWPNPYRAASTPPSPLAYGDTLAFGGGLGNGGYFIDDIEYSVTNLDTGEVASVTIDFEGAPVATGAPVSSYVSSSVAKRELLL